MIKVFDESKRAYYKIRSYLTTVSMLMLLLFLLSIVILGSLVLKLLNSDCFFKKYVNKSHVVKLTKRNAKEVIGFIDDHVDVFLECHGHVVNENDEVVEEEVGRTEDIRVCCDYCVQQPNCRCKWDAVKQKDIGKEICVPRNGFFDGYNCVKDSHCESGECQKGKCHRPPPPPPPAKVDLDVYLVGLGKAKSFRANFVGISFLDYFNEVAESASDLLGVHVRFIDYEAKEEVDPNFKRVSDQYVCLISRSQRASRDLSNQYEDFLKEKVGNYGYAVFLSGEHHGMHQRKALGQIRDEMKKILGSPGHLSTDVIQSMWILPDGKGGNKIETRSKEQIENLVMKIVLDAYGESKLDEVDGSYYPSKNCTFEKQVSGLASCMEKQPGHDFSQIDPNRKKEEYERFEDPNDCEFELVSNNNLKICCPKQGCPDHYKCDENNECESMKCSGSWLSPLECQPHDIKCEKKVVKTITKKQKFSSKLKRKDGAKLVDTFKRLSNGEKNDSGVRLGMLVKNVKDDEICSCERITVKSEGQRRWQDAVLGWLGRNEKIFIMALYVTEFLFLPIVCLLCVMDIVCVILKLFRKKDEHKNE